MSTEKKGKRKEKKRRKKEIIRGVAGVGTLVGDLDLDTSANHAPKGGGEPELLVVATAAVKADYQAGAANPVLQHLDVVGQILHHEENRRK